MSRDPGDCIWDPEDEVGFQSSDQVAADELRTPVRTSRRRSRTTDIELPLMDWRRPDADESDIRHRAALTRQRSPSGLRRTEQRTVRPSDREQPGESTPIANLNASRVRQGRDKHGSPVALNFAGDDRAERIRPMRSQSSPPARHSRPQGPPLTLPTYDGKSDLRIFLMRFSAVANVYAWDNKERAQRIRLCLTGSAESCLYSLFECANYEEIVTELHRRFGTDQASFASRLELRNLRQNRGESLQELYGRVIRLSALAFSHERSAAVQTVTRDGFVNAVADVSVRRRLLELDCPDLASAYQAALRLSAIDDVLTQSEGRYARHVVSEESQQQMADKIKGLEKQLELLSSNVSKLVDQTIQSRRLVSDESSVAASRATGAPKGSAPSTARRCYHCNSDQHLYRQCDRRPSGSRKLKPEQKINHVVLTPTPSHKAIELTFTKDRKNTRLYFLPDTGSNVSIISSDYLKFCDYTMRPSHVRLFTASGDALHLRGEVCLEFQLAGRVYTEIFQVSDAVVNNLLSFDFLKRVGCVWQVGDDRMLIDGVSVPLVTLNESKSCVRRIIVAENTQIPARHIVNLPITLKCSLIKESDNDYWLSEPMVINGCLITARSVTSGNVRNSLRICNATDRTVKLGKGANVGYALKVTADDVMTPPVRQPGIETVCTINDRVKQRDCVNNNLLTSEEVMHCRTIGSSVDFPCTSEVNDRRVSKHNLSTILETSCDSAVVPLLENDDDEDQDRKRLALVDQLMSTISVPVTDQERSQIRELLTQFKDVYALGPYDAGCFKDYEHSFILKDKNCAPVVDKLRRYSAETNKLINAELAEMERWNIIRRGASPWANNLLAVLKPGSGPDQAPRVRLAVDLRRTNDLLLDSVNHPLGHVEKNLLKLSGKVVLSKCDFKAAYFAIKLSPESQKIMSIRSERQQYQFLRAPFGAKEIGSLYSHLLAKVLQSIEDEAIFVFLDDVCLASSDVSTHISLLKKFLFCVRRGGIRISVEKSSVFVDTVELCGFKISNGQIHLTEHRRNAIRSLAYPTSKKLLRSAIGYIMFVKNHCENLSSYLAPFLRMLRGNNKIQDTAELRILWQRLLERLASAPNLYIFDPQKKIVARSDSSLRKWSFSLYNEDSDGTRRPVLYLSGLHPESMKNHCIFRLELQALINGLKRVMYLLQGRSVLIEVDNSVVASIYKAKELNPHLARCLQFLNEFRLKFSQIPSKKNVDCDFLSRYDSEDDKKPVRDCRVDPPCGRCVNIYDNKCLAELGYVDRLKVMNSVAETVENKILPVGSTCGNSTVTAKGHDRRPNFGSIRDSDNHGSKNRPRRSSTTQRVQVGLTAGNASVSCERFDSNVHTGLTVAAQPRTSEIFQTTCRVTAAADSDAAEINTGAQSDSNTAALSIKDTSQDHCVSLANSLEVADSDVPVNHSQVNATTVRSEPTAGAQDVITSGNGLRRKRRPRARMYRRTANRGKDSFARASSTIGPVTVDDQLATLIGQPQTISDQQKTDIVQCSSTDSNAERQMSADKNSGATQRIGPDLNSALGPINYRTAERLISTCKADETDKIIKWTENVWLQFDSWNTNNDVGLQKADILAVTTRAGKIRLQQKENGENFCPSVVRPTIDAKFVWNKDSIKTAQLQDETLCQVIQLLSDNKEPDDNMIGIDADFRVYANQWESLVLIDGICYRRYFTSTGDTVRLQLLIPKSLRAEVCRLIHVLELAHCRVLQKHLQKLSETAYFPSQKQEFQITLYRCMECLMSGPKREPKTAPISCRQYASAPGVSCYTDLIGPLDRSVSGKKYILVIQDAFSKKLYAYAIRDKSSKIVASKILKCFTQNEFYVHIHSDNGSEYKNSVFAELCRLLNIAHSFNPPFHPRANCAERVNKSVIQLLTRSCSESDKWDKVLPFVVSCFNNTPNKSTGYSPNFLHYSRSVGTVQNALMSTDDEILKNVPHGQFLADSFSRMRYAYDMTQRSLKKQADYNQKHYNRFRKPLGPVAIGTKVQIFSCRRVPGQCEKIRRTFQQTGTILKRVTATLFSVKLEGRRKPCLISSDKIRIVPS